MAKWAKYLDEQEVRKTLSILREDGDVFEVRILGGRNKKESLSGYFKDVDSFLSALESVSPESRNVYVTLGDLKEYCYAKDQQNHFKSGAQATSDDDVAGYRWLFIDLDPVRASGISSTDEELGYAKEAAKKVYEYLRYMGFNEPVKALSGNGCHLLYRIQILNNEEGRQLIERCLKVLSSLFDTDKVKVDTTNYNPSRICKLHGTLAQKGSVTDTRPHRMSRIFSGHPGMEITSKVFLQKLADELPEEAESPQRQYGRNDYQQNDRSEFDLLDFMSRYGITYKKDSNDRAEIYRLDECPFNPSHRDGDAKIFLYHNGAIAFKCHHNSCRQYRWQDVRMKYDSGAYDRSDSDSRIDDGWKKHNRDKTAREVPYDERVVDTDKDGNDIIFRTARQIIDDPDPEHEYIHSGIRIIDEKLHGLQKTAVSVISGNRGSGKSTLIGQIIINAVNDGHTVICYSGELNNKKYLEWLIRQAAGKGNVRTPRGGAYVPDDAREKIVNWMGEHFRLYNNQFGNSFKAIEKQLRDKLKRYKADLCIIDNLMALDLSEYDRRDKYEAQTQFVWALKNLAELSNTHVIFVAHPKKVNGFIRLNDISGTGNIGNIIDNAFMVHRNNRDFQNGYKDAFGKEAEKEKWAEPGMTNIIEIAKDREFGTQDEFIPLFFEESTKRLRNSRDECIHYGWEPEEGFTEALPDDIPF